MSQAVRAVVLGCVAVLAFASVPRVAAIQEKKKVLESLVDEFYGVELEAFHAALLKHIIASYRQK